MPASAPAGTALQRLLSRLGAGWTESTPETVRDKRTG
jgi:hypothetical protein